MPPERMELWAKNFEIKEGLLGSPALSQSLFLEVSWMCCSCLHFPMAGMLDGKELGLQLRIGLAWQRGGGGGLFVGRSKGDEL